jgi:hypothetical protein
MSQTHHRAFENVVEQKRDLGKMQVPPKLLSKRRWSAVVLATSRLGVIVECGDE